MSGLFVTATDTDVGKTVITGAIAAGLRARGQGVGVMKPFASGGARRQGGRLVSDDATFLMAAAGQPESTRPLVNPICLEPALTPAVAAKISGTTLDLDRVLAVFRTLAARHRYTLVEGVGGITAPLWEDYLVADLAKNMALPLIIVVRPNLGTINHTVLTAMYARQRGLKIAGLIINNWPEASASILEQSNLDYITRLTGLTLLGKFPHTGRVGVADCRTGDLASLAEKHLDLERIIAAMEAR